MEKIHFIGIGGIGMSALAQIALEKGYLVSGSDISDKPILHKLQASGATIHIGHNADVIDNTMTVVYSTDIQKDNVEYRQAKNLKVRMLHRSEMLCHFMHGKKALLVAGSHGKTTTSGLLAHVLEKGGYDPAYVVGGIIASLGSNGKWGNGEFFVAEADESDGTFLKYTGYGAIITNIGSDHLSYWRSEEALKIGFQNFAKQIFSTQHLFWCSDNQTLKDSNIDGVSYGSTQADWQIKRCEQKSWSLVFDLEFQGKTFEAIEVPLIGNHNALNASAVFGLLYQLKIPEEVIRAGFLSFQGVGRRAERKGCEQNVLVYDDYAHHPNEIETTIRGMRKAADNRRLVVVFQPHRFSRTKDCLELFSKAFIEPDALIVTDIFSAGEAPLEGITIEVLIQKLQNLRTKPIHYSSKENLLPFLCDFVRPDDFVVTMGAGDITKVGPELLEKLALSRS